MSELFRLTVNKNILRLTWSSAHIIKIEENYVFISQLLLKYFVYNFLKNSWFQNKYINSLFWSVNSVLHDMRNISVGQPIFTNILYIICQKILLSNLNNTSKISFLRLLLYIYKLINCIWNKIDIKLI